MLNECAPTNVFSADVTDSSTEHAMLAGDCVSCVLSPSILLSLSMHISLEPAIKLDMGSLEISLGIDFSIELGCRKLDNTDD